MSEIKPCPYCGKLAAKCEPSHYIYHEAFSVICLCGTGSRYAESAEKAIEIWNTRPIEDALRAELVKTQKALDLACYAIGEVSCPYKHDICKTPAESLVNGCVECWKEYFLKKAGK
mgnify:CR=1 FL=1